MQVAIVTLFPEMFAALTKHGVSGRGIGTGLLELSFWNPRDYCTDKYRNVDDKPFGGGPGMLMKTEPLPNWQRKRIVRFLKFPTLPSGEITRRPSILIITMP